MLAARMLRESQALSCILIIPRCCRRMRLCCMRSVKVRVGCAGVYELTRVPSNAWRYAFGTHRRESSAQHDIPTLSPSPAANKTYSWSRVLHYDSVQPTATSKGQRVEPINGDTILRMMCERCLASDGSHGKCETSATDRTVRLEARICDSQKSSRGVRSEGMFMSGTGAQQLSRSGQIRASTPRTTR